MCRLESVDGEAIVFRDELWSCELPTGYEVPGWFFLRVRRHALGWQELTPDELDSLGQHLKDLTGAVAEATGALATYSMNFGESYAHFHVLVAARGEDVPAERRGGNIVNLRAERLDRAGALTLVPLVRSAYRAALAGR
ncbi:hypothetical protein B7R25_03760 [Subtercola boreus]|uniref:Diadenosine tetraphosphate hydrolase n=1 Tax=Subtercola boreus TaxID=120213 RepID=A0A3E0WFH1_9MICO|nr:hypothetical protein B7R24_03750 [Subtercola boreus]RFA23201.1 hypothetical protein B7R23_03745 [Subtercola boreus]RFA28951.1 hypothetical protein B7R25_03760 [Subtercola boreus]